MSPIPLPNQATDPAAQQNFDEIAAYLSGTAEAVALARKAADSQPAALVHNSVAQSIASGATATINFDVEDFDVGGLHGNVTNNTRLTVSTTGLYLLVFNGTVSAATPVCSAQFLKNGAAISALINLPVPYPAVAIANAGDYFEVSVTAGGGGGSNNVTATFAATRLSKGS
jgi:hypothetical protein